MVTRLIGSHRGLAPRWMAMINNNEVEAWCLPQGQIVHLYSAMAAGLPGRLLPSVFGTLCRSAHRGRKDERPHPRTTQSDRGTSRFAATNICFIRLFLWTWSLCAAPMLMKTATYDR